MNEKLQAAIGIGSNSVRLLVARRREMGIVAVRRAEVVTRLAGYRLSTEDTPLLDQRAIEETLGAVRRFAAEASGIGATMEGIIATEAVRVAANRDELTSLVEQKVGMPISIISGEEEARLGWLAVVSDYPESDGPVGVLDVGGGSSDLSIGYPREVTPQSTLSLPFGAHSAMKRYDLDKRVEYSKTIGIIASLGIELYDAAAAMQPRPASGVVIGGTAEVLMSVYAMLEGQELDAHTTFERDWLGRNIVRLAALDHAGRAGMGVPEGKADIAAAGGAILLVLLDAWRLQQFYASERSILDGYLLDIAHH
jgi:exopolyphosphatase/guanosine-5'-triphosphate,3'-diphosphate pyrophosphatase